jgi:hypothetical protein
MKLPIGTIANFALKRIVLPAIGKAVASNKNPLTKQAAIDALRQAAQDEVNRRLNPIAE